MCYWFINPKKTGDGTSKIGSYNRQPWNLYLKKKYLLVTMRGEGKTNKKDMET